MNNKYIKNTIFAGFLAIGMTFGIVGCASKSGESSRPAEQVVESYRPVIKPVAKAILDFSIQQIENENDKLEAAKYMYSIATGVRTLITGDLPEAEKINEIVKLWTSGGPDVAQFEEIAQAIAAVYKVEKEKLENKAISEVKASLIVLEELAAAAEEIGSKYIK